MPGLEVHQGSDEVKSIGTGKGDDDVAEGIVSREKAMR